MVVSVPWAHRSQYAAVEALTIVACGCAGYLMGRARHVAPRIRESDRVRRLQHELTLAKEQVRRSSARLDAVERSYAAERRPDRRARHAHRRGVPQRRSRTRASRSGIFDDATAAELRQRASNLVGRLAAQPAMSASHVANPWRSRVVSRYAWIEAVAAIFACAVSFILPFGPVLLLVGWLGGPTLAALAALAWIASGLLVVLPTVSESVVSWLTGAKEPTQAEADRLGAAWDDVCRATTIEPHTFALRVIPCPPPSPQKPPYINAFAAGTNVVAVSSDALAQLDDRKLRAILAHELGHHAGYDAVPRGLIAWYLGLTEAILWPFPRRTAGAILRVLYLPVTLVLGLASRPCEFAADAFAARLGHGPALQRLLADLGPNNPPHAHHRDPRQPPRDDRSDPPPRRRVGVS